MRLHHTKNKGDLGLLHAQLDLAKKGFGVLVPMTEHEAFDLVAYREGVFYRVQVKYQGLVNGVITVPMKTCWADRRGVHTAYVDKNAIDLLCVYCPDTDRCYYVDPLVLGLAFSLRVREPRNAQRKGILWADDHLGMPLSVRGVPAASRERLEEAANVRQSSPPNRRP